MNGGLALVQCGWNHRVVSVMICLAMCDALMASESPSFEREVRPILARFCFKCHGPDDAQRQSGLRLDVRDAAIAPAESGKRAIVPGQPEVSELLRRINLPNGDEEHMPPPTTKLELSAELADESKAITE